MVLVNIISWTGWLKTFGRSAETMGVKVQLRFDASIPRSSGWAWLTIHVASAGNSSAVQGRVKATSFSPPCGINSGKNLHDLQPGVFQSPASLYSLHSSQFCLQGI